MLEKVSGWVSSTKDELMAKVKALLEGKKDEAEEEEIVPKDKSID